MTASPHIELLLLHKGFTPQEAEALEGLIEQLEAAENEREQAYATAQAMNEAQFQANARVTELKEQLEA